MLLKLVPCKRHRSILQREKSKSLSQWGFVNSSELFLDVLPTPEAVYISTSDLWQVWGAAKGNAVWNWIGKNVCPWHNLNAELFMILKLGTLTVHVSLLGGQSCEIVWACILKVMIQCHRVQTDFPLIFWTVEPFCLGSGVPVYQYRHSDVWIVMSGCCQGQGHRSESSEECFFCSSWILVAIKTICKQAWYADTSVLDSASCEDVLMTVRSQWGPYFQQNDCPDILSEFDMPVQDYQ